jgi:hypothetical protein
MEQIIFRVNILREFIFYFFRDPSQALILLGVQSITKK